MKTILNIAIKLLISVILVRTGVKVGKDAKDLMKKNRLDG